MLFSISCNRYKSHVAWNFHDTIPETPLKTDVIGQQLILNVRFSFTRVKHWL